MKKILFVIVIFSALTVALPAQASWKDSSFVTAILRIVQNILPIEETPVVLPPEKDVFEEEFVDPREIQQVLREMKDLKRELNRFAKQLKKIANTGDDLNQINGLLEQIANFENSINREVNLRDTIQEFRDAQMWEELNRFRAKIEIPKESAQWNKEIKRLEKMFTQKKYQNLGFNLESTKVKAEEIKSGLAKVLEYYNSGSLEEAMEEFNDLRQDFHPGEITSVIQRTQELMNRMKSIKDNEAKEQIKGAFSEVINSFNEGEYRLARELLDESFNDIAGMIYKASLIGKKKGYSKEQILQMTEQLEEKIKGRVEEKTMRIKETEEKKEAQPAPVQPTTVEPTPKVEPIPTTPSQ